MRIELYNLEEDMPSVWKCGTDANGQSYVSFGILGCEATISLPPASEQILESQIAKYRAKGYRELRPGEDMLVAEIAKKQAAQLAAEIEAAQAEDAVAGDAGVDPAHLCIQWDIGDRSPEDALDQRNEVLVQAEKVLEDTGLLVDWDGASIGMGTVETTFAVTDFEAAKATVWDSLSDAQKAWNCRIFDEEAGL